MSTVDAIRPKVLLTAEDYQVLPETGPRYQLIEGELHNFPAPNRFHQDISRNLEIIIGQYLLQNPIGVLYNAPFDVYLDDINVYQPDLLFVSKERRHILTDAGAKGAPDLIIEVLSKRTRKIDEIVKKKMFAQKGTVELWLIDPVARTISIFNTAHDPDTPTEIYGAEATFERRLFPSLVFDTKAIFSQPF